MAISPYIDEDLTEQRDQARAQLLTDLSAGINATQRAAVTLEQLRSGHVYDIELVDSRDGRDIPSFIDESIRCARAAYAVIHMIIENEKP
jgi:hypothetical protein